jgi:CBS domain-containing protein
VEHDCGEIPVCGAGRKPIGVVTDRDIVCRLIARGKDPLRLRASDCMSSPVITVAPETSLEDCSRLMEQYQVRRLPVVAADGALCGMVAQADLVKRAPGGIAIEVIQKVSAPSVMASAVGR